MKVKIPMIYLVICLIEKIYFKKYYVMTIMLISSLQFNSQTMKNIK